MLRTLSKYSLHTLLLLVCCIIAVSSVMAAAPAAVYGTATVDGNPAEWDLTTDFFKNMHEAGAPTKTLLSKSYLRYDCESQTLYVLVLTQPGVTADNSAADAWVKVYDLSSSTQVDGNSSSFSWVFNGQTRVGYEASFPLPASMYEKIEIHLSVTYANESGRTSSTGKKNDGATPLSIDCPYDVCATGANWMNEYNLIVLENLSTNSDVELKTITKNYTNSSSANFGNHLPADFDAQTASLEIAGTISSGSAVNVNKGSVAVNTGTSIVFSSPNVGYDVNGRRFNVNQGNSGATVFTDGNLPTKLATIKSDLEGWSSQLSNLLSNNTVNIPSSQPGPLNFNVDYKDANGVAVFTINGNVFSNNKVQQIEIKNNVNASLVIINVSGTSVNWTQGNMVGSWLTGLTGRANTLWNFHSATTINLNSKNFMGALLAPKAAVTTQANIDGATAVKSLTTTSEIHKPLFNANCEEETKANVILFKDVDPNTDPGTFDLKLDGVVKYDEAGSGDYTTAIEIETGSHTVSESNGAASNLADYTSTAVCYNITDNLAAILFKLNMDDTEGAKTLIKNSPVLGSGSTSAEFNASDGHYVFCLFTNTRKAGSIQVTKDIVGDATGTFNICVAPAANPTAKDCKSFNGEETKTWSNLPPGSYIISEYDAGSIWNESADQQVSVVANQTTNVTVTNTYVPPKGSIQVAKAIVGGGTGIFNICAAPAANPTAKDCKSFNGEETKTWSNLPPGSYIVSEQDAGDDWNEPADQQVSVVANQTTNVTMTNTYVPPKGQIIVIKDVTTGTDAQDFSFNAYSYNPFALYDLFSLDDDGDSSSGLRNTWVKDVDPGTYAISEADLSDWSVDIHCTSTNLNRVFSDKMYDENNQGTGISFDVDDDETVTCTFKNTYTPRPAYIRVTKDIVGSGTGAFTLCVDSDNNCQVFNGEETKTFEVTAGTHSVYEKDAGENWIEPQAQEVTVVPGETKDVTVTNTYVPPKSYIRVTKDIVGDATGTFTLCVDQNCQTFNGEESKLFEVSAGQHIVSEQDAGENWIEPQAQQVQVAEGQTVDVTMINTYVPPVLCPGLDPLAHLSAVIEPTGNPYEWRARIFNTSDCKYDVGFASYKKFDSNNATQGLFSSDTRLQIPQGETIITLTVPMCAAQLDVFFDASHLGVYSTYAGKQAQLDQAPLVLPAFATGLYGPFGNWYGPRLLGYKHVNQGYCTPPVVYRNLTIQVNTDPMFDADVFFDGDLPDVNAAELGDFDVNGFGGMYAFQNLPAGIYNVTELLPEGYTLTSVTCNSAPMIVNGSSVMIDLTAVDMTCTFYNTGEVSIEPLSIEAPVVFDDDQDGVANDFDICPGTADAVVNTDGCGASQLDDDADGVSNAADACPGTIAGVAVDAAGCEIPAAPQSVEEQPAAPQAVSEAPAETPQEAAPPAETTPEVDSAGQ